MCRYGNTQIGVIKMKIPKYIEALCYRRAKLAEDLNSVDIKLSEWLEKNNIPVEECDYRSGCEMYVNPDASAQRVLKAIQNKENTE